MQQESENRLWTVGGSAEVIAGMLRSLMPMIDPTLTSRELLWQYFLPTVYEESAITPEPLVGQTRIFKNVRVKLQLNCSTSLDVYFMSKTVRSPFELLFPSLPSCASDRPSNAH